MKKVSYDYVIVGAGAAGLASSQYAARAGLNTLVIDVSDSGGQVLRISRLENYPGLFPAVSGSDFSALMRKQAELFGVSFVSALVTGMDKVGRLFHIHTADTEYLSPALLIATGAEHKLLDVKGEKELSGVGVSYCGVCDGPFFRGKKVLVVGGGDSAVSESLYLSSIAAEVMLVHRRRQFRAQKVVVQQLSAMANITVRCNTVVKKICGNGHVESVILGDTETETETELPVSAVFVFVGMHPQTELVETLPKDNDGYIKTNEKMETLIPGLYAAGDVRSKPFRQVVTAVSDGATAAHQADIYIHSLSEYIGAGK
jgi:thioredoxin reductase (NADPH)